jgi:hypothetical protein
VSTDPVMQARWQCSDYLSRIEELFKPGAKVTLLVRRPNKPEQDFMLTNDTIDGAIEILERSRPRPAT